MISAAWKSCGFFRSSTPRRSPVCSPYLIVADGRAILFDLGLGPGRRSTLQRNAQQLGVDLAAVDMIVISHAHPDNCGGPRAWLRRSFDLPDQARNGITVRTPIPMHHSAAKSEFSCKPAVLAPGIATTGPIARQLFLLGWTPEQALIVNVRGKGIVVIVGCGHQGLTRLISRVRRLTAEPICAVIGGLHLPVHGLYAQDIIGSAKWPWRRTTEQDVTEVISVLRECQPRLVAPHRMTAQHELSGALPQPSPMSTAASVSAVSSSSLHTRREHVDVRCMPKSPVRWGLQSLATAVA